MYKWEFHQPLAGDYLTEIWGPFWRAIYDSAVTGADNDQLWVSLTKLLRDFIGTLKDLIMTLYRCHLCHLWGLPVGLPWYAGPDSLAVVRLWLGTSEPQGWDERRSTAVSKLLLRFYFLTELFCIPFNFPFPAVVLDVPEVRCEILALIDLKITALYFSKV